MRLVRCRILCLLSAAVKLLPLLIQRRSQERAFLLPIAEHGRHGKHGNGRYGRLGTLCDQTTGFCGGGESQDPSTAATLGLTAFLPWVQLQRKDLNVVTAVLFINSVKHPAYTGMQSSLQWWCTCEKMKIC